MKHIHCDLIKAWADGAKIQADVKDGTGWHDTFLNIPTWAEKYNYRIKPEVKKYRVSLHLIGKSYVTSTSDNDAEALLKEKYHNFIRWLTDWTEYELETGTETSSK